MERKNKTGIFPKGRRCGLPNGLDINIAREMTADENVNREHFVYKATGNIAGQSKEYKVGIKRTGMRVPGVVNGANTVYLGPEVEEASLRNS